MKKLLLLFLLIAFNGFGQDTLNTDVETYIYDSDCSVNTVGKLKWFLVKNTKQEDTLIRGCKGYIWLPELDFTKQNVLLYNIPYGSPLLKKSFRLYTIVAQKKYIFISDLHYDFARPDNYTSSRHVFAIVPVLDPSYTIEYKVIETTEPIPPKFKTPVRCGN
jgi:hypothetical protein